MKWYLVKTKPGDEQRVERNLATGDLLCYSPRIKKTVQRVGGPTTVAEPLFPRYVFVRTVLGTSYQKINHTRGVVGIVNYGLGPVTVAEEIIDALKERERDGFIQQTGNRAASRKGRRFPRFYRDGKTLTSVFERGASQTERVVLLLKNIL